MELTVLPVRADGLSFERALALLLRRHGITTGLQSGRRRTLPFTCAVARHTDGERQALVRHPAVGLIKEYIDEHYAEPVRLDTLSRLTGLSRYHLQRLFREAEGQSPNDYLREVRIRRAAELLEHGTPITEAALATGFYDQSHFTNTFRRATGTTPRRYRRKRKIFQERP